MKNKPYMILGCLLSVFLLSSCITNKQKKYLQGVEYSFKPIEYQQYKLQVNDEVAYAIITLNQETQAFYNMGNSLNRSASGNAEVRYRIDEEGNVTLPTIGKVKLQGLTLREAEQEVKRAFLSIVPDAEIKLSLVNNYFYIHGDGKKGEHLVYKENLTIFQALAMAGDISATGDKKKVKIIRKGIDGNDFVKTINLRDDSVFSSEFYYIQPNDVIYIPTNPNSFFRVDSVSSFVSLILTPLSLIVLVISLF